MGQNLGLQTQIASATFTLQDARILEVLTTDPALDADISSPHAVAIAASRAGSDVKTSTIFASCKTNCADPDPDM